MRTLHQVLSLKKRERNPARRLETSSKTQAEVASTFGYRVDPVESYSKPTSKTAHHAGLRTLLLLISETTVQEFRIDVI
jgi:hypothetical protein